MKKNYILIYRIILSVIIIVGISLNLFAKNFDFNMLLSYYTIQSNMIVLIVLVLLIINRFKKLKIFKTEQQIQNIKGASTLIILVTGIIFVTLLAKYTRDWSGYRLYSSYLLHYISPLLVLIDYLFFDNITTRLKFRKNITWFIYPLIYYVFGVIRILFLDGFIPYPFMNVKELGAFKSILIVLILLIVFYLVSVLMCIVKNYINRKNYKND